jgi:hypothetical protein
MVQNAGKIEQSTGTLSHRVLPRLKHRHTDALMGFFNHFYLLDPSRKGISVRVHWRSPTLFPLSFYLGYQLA